IYRFCKPWLEQKQVAVIELLHSSTLQNQISMAGAYYSNTVQKVAIAQVEGTSISAQDRVKELYSYCDQISVSSRQDPFAGKNIPTFSEENFHAYQKEVFKTVDEQT